MPTSSSEMLPMLPVLQLRAAHVSRRSARSGHPALAVAATLVAALSCLSAHAAAAQDAPATVGVRAVQTPSANAPASATSLLLGGFLIADSRLALAKVEHARGRWALVGDVTRDGVNERWTPTSTQVASRGAYVLWAASLSARRYTREGGRGFYGEVGGGAGRATLEVTPDAGATVARRATVPLATLGIGGRLGVGQTPAFVELGLRSAIPLATHHLHAGATPPAGSTRDLVSYQSWYFGRGKASSQMYVGIGLTR
jgi:hypothetical protein